MCYYLYLLTLPYAKRHLQIFPTPAIHLFIVASRFPKVVTSHRKQSASHCGTARRTDLRFVIAAGTNS